MLSHTVLDPGYTILNKTTMAPALMEQSDMTWHTINASSQSMIGTLKGKEYLFTNMKSKLFYRDLLWASLY